MENYRAQLLDNNNARYKCIACRRVIVHLVTSECGHHFCSSCFEMLSFEGESCPGGDEECRVLSLAVSECH